MIKVNYDQTPKFDEFRDNIVVMVVFFVTINLAAYIVQVDSKIRLFKVKA